LLCFSQAVNVQVSEHVSNAFLSPAFDEYTDTRTFEDSPNTNSVISRENATMLLVILHEELSQFPVENVSRIAAFLRT
jgi:hypothetical protein